MDGGISNPSPQNWDVRTGRSGGISKSWSSQASPFCKDEATQCYRVRPDYRFPILKLTEDEALGQAVATAISNVPGHVEAGGARPTTRKLAASSSEPIPQILADAARLIEAFDLKLVNHGRHQEAIRTAQYALLQKKQLAGSYDSPYEPKPIKLSIHPYRLCLVKRAWYVIGHVDGEETPKTFRVARFKTLRMLDRPAKAPQDFDLKTYFGNAWSVYRGEVSYEVELRFTRDAARVLTETTWHHTQRAKTHRDGSVTLNFRVDGLCEILHWLLSWAGRVQVQGPAELKALFLRTLQDAVRMNSEATSF